MGLRRKAGESVITGDPAIIAVAQAGYRLSGELACPEPDFVMRRIYRENLEAAIAALTYEQRVALTRWEPPT